MLLIGYSSFAILVIRSNSNPPIDENNPEDAVGLLSYLKESNTVVGLLFTDDILMPNWIVEILMLTAHQFMQKMRKKENTLLLIIEKKLA